MMRWLVAFLFVVVAHVHGFRPGMKMSWVASVLRAEEGASSKGFGKPKEVVEIGVVHHDFLHLLFRLF